jgi:hypothetical protein
VSLETGLVLSVIVVPMLLGAWDLGLVLRAQARLDAGLHGAILYAWANANGNAGLSAGPLQVAVSGGANGLSVAISLPTYSCECVNAHGATTNTLLGLCLGLGINLCPTGQQTAQYVSLSLSTQVELPVSVPYLSNPITLTDNATVRVQ